MKIKISLDIAKLRLGVIKNYYHRSINLLTTHVQQSLATS